MIAKFTFNYNGGFEKKENAVFQQGSIGVDSYQVFAPFLTTTQVYIKTKRNGDLEFSLWKQLDYNSTIGGWLKTATQDELLVDGEMKVVFKFNNLVSQETSLWVRKGTLIVPEMTTYEALRDYVENQEIRIDQIINGATDIAFNKTGTNLNSDFVEQAIKEVNTKSDANAQNIADMKDGTTTVKKAEQDKNGNDIFNTYETKSDATSKLALKADKTYVDAQDQALDDYFESEITKIKDGTTIVKKTEQDKNGNDIVATYETKADATSKKSELDGEIDVLDERVTDLEEKTTQIYDYKGSVLFANLPTTGQVIGDVYNILDNFTLGGEDYLAGTDVAWNGAGWNALGSHIPNGDEVQYSLGVSVNQKIDTKLDSDKVKTSFSATPLDTNVISEKLAKDTFDTKEALANKATNFAVVNDTKYPTTKAVDDSYATKTALNLKANIAQEAWITPTLVNGWTQVSGNNCQYIKDNFGFVRIQGRVSSGTIGQTIFTLPNGYRPSATRIIPVVCSGGVITAVFVDTNGFVTSVAGNNTYVSLDSITFKAV